MGTNCHIINNTVPINNTPTNLEATEPSIEVLKNINHETTFTEDTPPFQLQGAHLINDIGDRGECQENDKENK
jgi:hypothetical protein